MSALYITLTLRSADQILLRYWSDRPGNAKEQRLSRVAISNLLNSTDTDLIDLPVNLKPIENCAEPDLVLALSVDPSMAHLGVWQRFDTVGESMREKSAIAAL